MKNISLEKEKIKVDFSDESLPEAVRNFMPDVYRNGDGYLCILGSEPDSLIVGTGITVIKALEDWDKSYRERHSGKNK